MVKKESLLGEKSYANLAIRMIIGLCVTVLMGTILLTIVYALPTDEMKQNVARSSALFDYEGIYPQIVTGYKSTQLDNYSDAYMFANAIYPGSGNPLTDAMSVKRIEYNDLSMPQSLTSYANDVDAEFYEIDYPRYWHGYLVVLKPLLNFFDVGDLKILNMICQGIVIFLVISLLLEKRGKRYALAFLMAVLLINPVTVSVSMHYSSVFYITMFMLYVIWKQPAFFIGKNKIFYYSLLFFGVGMLTSFFDLFTYPLVTLGLPLISLWVIEGDNYLEWKKQIKIIILVAACWAIGYAGMWIGKFMIGSIITGRNLFGDAFSRTVLYTASNDKSVSILECILRSIKVVLKWPYVIGFGGTFIYFVISIWKENKKLSWDWKKMLPFLLLMLLPFSDMLITGHVYWHYWFTYRELAVTLFAGYCMVLECLRGKKFLYENSNQNG